MRVADFDYELDPERIAQRPERRRDHSKLLVLDRDEDVARCAADAAGLLGAAEVAPVLEALKKIPEHSNWNADRIAIALGRLGWPGRQHDVAGRW